jgi:hypothetical protein
MSDLTFDLFVRGQYHAGDDTHEDERCRDHERHRRQVDQRIVLL